MMEILLCKDQEIQWINANNAYKILDDANFPYGILVGNHDVGHLSNDYTNFYKYFGKSRYVQNPWYGESYKNNKGHYVNNCRWDRFHMHLYGVGY